DCPIADILLQGSTCAQDHVYIHHSSFPDRGRCAAISGHGCQSKVITRWRPKIIEHLRRGGRLFCLQTIFLPVSSGTLLRMALHSTAIPISVLTVKNTPPPPSKTLPAHS
ncbi:unnamed protein product, partial [Staurois parvus]